MKTVILTLTILLICTYNLLSQDFAGKRVYNGTLTLTFDQNRMVYKSSNSVYSMTNAMLNASFMVGKVKQNNAYTAYGFSLGVKFTEASGTTQYYLGPVIQFGKFIKIFDQFYFSPKSTFSLAGVYGTKESVSNLSDKGFTLGVDLAPLSFVYRVNEKVMLNMSLGQFALNYAYLNSSNDYFSQTSHNLNINGNLSNYTSLGMFYLF